MPLDLSKPRRIGLALSGGGVRAAAFHAGVLKWLAERGLLKDILHISSVSGGTLFIGLVFRSSNYVWPSSEQYLEETLPNIRTLLTRKSLQCNAILRLLAIPWNWRFLLSRANVLAQSIEKYWRVTAKLEDLPTLPLWSINGTTAENGRRFRFKGITIGDYEIGYANAGSYKLADAMAVSAAFPCGIGPLTLYAKKCVWLKRKGWDLSLPEEEIAPPFTKLHLYDGGVYDNLGLEPLFDVGAQIIKSESTGALNFIVVSDAGAAFSRRSIPRPLHPGRLKIVADAAFDQVRALRVRSFVNYLQKNPQNGMYLQIGSEPVQSLKRFRTNDNAQASGIIWLSANEVSCAGSYKTTLGKMSEEVFDLLLTHGYQTARWNELITQQ